MRVVALTSNHSCATAYKRTSIAEWKGKRIKIRKAKSVSEEYERTIT